jgi:hypothetical protein
MAWVRIDDQFTDHPKLAAAGPVAGWVYVSGLCYAARYLTDGFVPETIALRFDGSSPEVLENLVECSLWDRVNGGYLIHDFLDYNPPASKVNTLEDPHTDACQSISHHLRSRLASSLLVEVALCTPLESECCQPERLQESKVSRIGFSLGQLEGRTFQPGLGMRSPASSAMQPAPLR